MIASLPMYDWPELVQANDELWRNIWNCLDRQGISAPGSLTRGGDEGNSWLAPDLLLGQTCGYPFITQLKGKVQYLATPCYDVEGCSGPNYSSAIIARKDSSFDISNLQKARFSYNSPNSWSGFRVLAKQYGELSEYFKACILSGSHRRSAEMVSQGQADVAAIDAVCWHYLQIFEPDVAGLLKVIAWSDSYPALPIITSLNTPRATVLALRKCLSAIGCELKDEKSAGLQILERCDVLAEDAYCQMLG